MIKKKKDNTENNGRDEALIKAITDLGQRIEDLETKKGTDAARLYIADRVFNTDRSHLRELTVIPLRAVRCLDNADTVGSVLDPEVQAGVLTLGQVWRESHYRHMRSVKGNLLEKGKDLAMEQARSSETEDLGEQSTLGKGL